jgi:hypothetical protein
VRSCRPSPNSLATLRKIFQTLETNNTHQSNINVYLLIQMLDNQHLRIGVENESSNLKLNS